MDRTRSRRAREPDAQAGRFACRSGQGGALLKPWVASAGAVAARFIVTALASTAADAVMHAAGIFPSAPRLMSDPLFALAAAYRAVFTIAGGYVTAPSGARPAHAPCMDIGRDRSCCGTGGRGRLLRHRRSGTRPCLVRNLDSR